MLIEKLVRCVPSFLLIILLVASPSCESGGNDAEGTEDDGEAPIAGTSIEISNLTHNSLTVSWGAATDNNTKAANLEYKLLYATEDVVNSVDNAYLGTQLVDWTANKLTFNVSLLSATKTYYFYVFVKDKAGNTALYPVQTDTTTNPALLDTSFGVSGKTFTQLAGDNYVYATALQSDGKIIVATTSGSEQIAVIRYTADGILDTKFGADSNGIVLTTVNAFPYDCEIQTDGKIIVAADGSGNNGDEDFVLIRYNSDGTLDASFGTAGTGIVFYDNSGIEDQTRALEIQSDGKIVVCGYSYDGNIVVVRLDVDGTEDTTFSVGGRVDVTPPSSFSISSGDVNYLALQSGKIIVAGGVHKSVSPYDMALYVIRLNINGDIDTSFGVNSNGFAITDIADKEDNATSLAIQNDGKIIVGGYSQGPDLNMRGVLLQYSADGIESKRFISPESSVGMYGAINTIALQSDGTIITGGTSSRDSIGDGDFIVTRFNSNLSVDNTFGDSGSVIIAGGPYYDFLTAIMFQGTKLIAAGEYYLNGDFSNRDILLMRIEP